MSMSGGSIVPFLRQNAAEIGGGVPSPVVRRRSGVVRDAHGEGLARLLADLQADDDRLQAWGEGIAHVLSRGGRCLIAAASDEETPVARWLAGALAAGVATARPPQALAAEELPAELAATEPIPGVLLLIDTQGERHVSMEALRAGREQGFVVFALTGRWPNPLGGFSDDAVCVCASEPAHVQAAHEAAAASIVAGAAAARRSH